MRRILPALFVLFASCGGGDGLSVDMTEHQFDPKSLTVEAGETVTWENSTDEAHTVTAAQSALPEGADYFSSGGAADEDEATDSVADELIQPGDTFEATFTEPGTYRYYCIPHRADGMEGTIVVE